MDVCTWLQSCSVLNTLTGNCAAAIYCFVCSLLKRAWVGRKHVIPITSKPEVKKRSQRWVQACDEMKEYQRQLTLLYPDARNEQVSVSVVTLILPI